MQDDWRILKKWNEFQKKAKGQIPTALHEFFELDEASLDTNNVVSGYDYRTFPRENAWRSEGKFLWKRQGLFVFDFRGRRGEQPEGVYILKKHSPELSVYLHCKVAHAYMNQREVIDEGIAEGNFERHFSTVCGRATLQLLEYEIKPHERKREIVRKIPAKVKTRGLETPLPR